MLTLFLLACAPWTTLSPPDPFAAPQTRTVGVGVFGGSQLPDARPAFSPGVYLNLRPLPRLELGVGGYVASDGLDWPRQIRAGGAGLSVRYYALKREKLALGPLMDFTGGSLGVGAVGVTQLNGGLALYGAVSGGMDYGAGAGTSSGFHTECGLFVRAPLGLTLVRDAWRLSSELSATWTPLATGGATACGLETYVDAPAPLVLVDGLRVGHQWPRRE